MTRHELDAVLLHVEVVFK